MEYEKQTVEIEQHKQIAFDLNIALLKEHYPKPEASENEQFYTAAYYDIRRFMLKNGFTHRQGSVYDSVEPLSYVRIHQLMDLLVQELPWLHKCVSTLDVTDIITMRQDLTEYIRNIAKQHSNEFELSPTLEQVREKPSQKGKKAPINAIIDGARQRQKEQTIPRETCEINNEMEK